MASKRVVYTRQTFYEVAVRRCVEAKMLLLPSHKKSCDGAVTCGLLAAECALKATLLHGYSVTSVDALGSDIREKVFEGKSGHAIPILWSQQNARVQVQKTPSLEKALAHLNGPNRYEYRYGGKRPLVKDAAPYVESCEIVVGWMKDVIR